MRFHFLEDKFAIPAYTGLAERPRLAAMLERSTHSFPATLVTGRTGTGKTAAVSAFARTKNAAWLRVEPAEADWCSFARYFRSAVTGLRGSGDPDTPARLTPGDRAPLIAAYLCEVLRQDAPRPELIVIDDLHHIFDADWFCDLFSMLVGSLPAATRLLLISRTKPPAPLWRMRSKQLLGVIDETTLAFTPSEAVALFAGLGLPRNAALKAHRKSFGRAGRLLSAV